MAVAIRFILNKIFKNITFEIIQLYLFQNNGTHLY
jgi:hypothetical protein